jgi:hypothetical protein
VREGHASVITAEMWLLGRKPRWGTADPGFVGSTTRKMTKKRRRCAGSGTATAAKKSSMQE